MSGIFNLLNEAAGFDNKDQMAKLESKTLHRDKLDSQKNMRGTKPKGLSMRTNSQMNIKHHVQPANANVCHDKKKDFRKLKTTQIDSGGSPVSPGKVTKKLIAQPFKLTKSAMKEEITIDKSTKTQLDEGCFKKPIPKSEKLPELEKLAYWRDNQDEFDHQYIRDAEKKFKDLFFKKKENIKPYEEEKFILDSEMLPIPIPEIVIDRSSDEEYNKLFSNDIQEISDLSDNDIS